MKKKIICAALAGVMAMSAAAISACADEVETEKSGATGTFRFDSGDWQSSRICFYIWDSSTTPTTYATKDGWIEDNTWGSRKKTGGTPVEGENGVFESFEFEIPEGHDVYVIFFDIDSGAQTFDCVLTEEAFGDTAIRTGEMLENPVDSEKKAEEVRFENCGLSARMCITSSGKVQGTSMTPNMDPAKEVATFVYNYLGMTEKLSGDPVVTEDSVANAISQFGTTADDVWAAYQTFEGKENYAPNEAKRFIKPTEDEPEDTDTYSRTDVDFPSNSSSKSTVSVTTSRVTSTTTTSRTASAVPANSSTVSTTSTTSTSSTSSTESTTSTTSEEEKTDNTSKASSTVTSPKTGTTVTPFIPVTLAVLIAAAASMLSFKRRED